MNYARWATKEEMLKFLKEVDINSDIKKSGIPMGYDKNKLYSFGLKNDFGTLYGFPVNQSCLTKEETIGTLKSFIEIDNKYDDINNTAKVWGNMIKILSE